MLICIADLEPILQNSIDTYIKLHSHNDDKPLNNCMYTVLS